MPVLRLNRRAIAAIKPRNHRTVYYDEALSGFALRVEPTGRMTYFCEYRPGAGGRRVLKKRYTIGNTEEFTPEIARKKAVEILATVRLGGDPAAERSHARAIPTLKEFADTYLKEEGASKLKAGTIRNYRSYINKHLAPTLGNLKLDDIQLNDVARLHRKIGENSRVTANRVLECLASIFRYASVCGLVPKGHNPTLGVTAFREQARERYLSTAELAQLGETLALAETEGLPWQESVSKHVPKSNRRTILDRHAVAAIRLLILTGLRLREVLHLRWSDIDFERRVALLPDTKTGRRYAVLTAPALAVLNALDRLGDYVIPGAERDKPRADLHRPWRAVRAHAGLGDVRLHDLRHSFASVGMSGGVPLAIVGKLLGHSQASTTQRYAHLADDPVRSAAETVGRQIASALAKQKSDIVPLKRDNGDAA